ncbi:MAG: hypothetical protein U9R58_11495 [Chloroflexota bacterium]|nr:hypothetical protein [Chloroflexota bacterium]
MERLELRISKYKALAAIARKLIIAVWYILTEQAADRFAVPEKVAMSIFSFAYKVGASNLPDGQSAREYTRAQLEWLGTGEDLEYIPWGNKKPKLPPSRLSAKG